MKSDLCVQINFRNKIKLYTIFLQAQKGHKNREKLALKGYAGPGTYPTQQLISQLVSFIDIGRRCRLLGQRQWTLLHMEQNNSKALRGQVVIPHGSNAGLRIEDSPVSQFGQLEQNAIILVVSARFFSPFFSQFYRRRSSRSK